MIYRTPLSHRPSLGTSAFPLASSVRQTRGLASALSIGALCCVLRSAGLAQDLPTPSQQPLDLGPSLMVGDESMLPETDAAEPAAMEAAESPDAVLDAPNPGPSASKWKFLPHFDIGIRWDDNIFIQPTNETSDLIFTFSPGIAIGYLDEETRLLRFLERENRASRIDRFDGQFLLLDYTPSFVVFSDNGSEDSFDQEARFEARWQLQKLSLAAQARYISVREANVELNQRLERTSESAGLSANYQLTERTSIEVGGYFQNDEYENASGNTEYRAEGFIGYELTPVVKFGLGVAFGAVEVENASNQTFERVLARGTYSLTEKLEASVLAGVEFRQSDGGGEDRTNPIFEIDLGYLPAEATRVSLNVSRQVLSSISEPAEFVTATGFALRFSRMLRDGVRLTAEGGYRNSEYSDSGIGEPRSDDYVYGQVALQYNFATWGSASVSYEYRQNDSSRSESDFTNNQIAFGFSVTF